MNADERGYDVNSVTEHIIRLAYKVSNALGCGFLEKVYENALVFELREHGYAVEQQARRTVTYREQVVGEYCADLIVDGRVIVELKCCRAFDDVMMAQCMNYLRITGLQVALLLNLRSRMWRYGEW